MKRTTYFLMLIVLLSCEGNQDRRSNKLETSDRVVPKQEIHYNIESIEFDQQELSRVQLIEMFKEDDTIPYRELRKVKDLFLVDSCFVGVMDIMTLNGTDTTIYLVNLCSSVDIAVLAGKSTAPGGHTVTTSLISNDTIQTTIEDSFLEDYVNNEYYVEITDSIVSISRISDGSVFRIARDSTRITRKISL
jgi:hypothetical protein